MNKLDMKMRLSIISPRRLLQALLSAIFLSGHVIFATECDVGGEGTANKGIKWLLMSDKPCDVTRVTIGGINTRSPIQPFTPLHVKRPIPSNNVAGVRDVYDLECKECPTDKVNATLVGGATRRIGWRTPKATGSNGLEMDIICKPHSLSDFEIGTTEVKCSGKERKDKQSKPVCSFAVTVNDFEAPNITCPNEISKQTDDGEPTARVNVNRYPNVTDNSLRIANVTCSRNDTKTRNVFPIGETRVTCQATDFSGNAAECHLKVVVTDLEAPKGRCPNNIITQTDYGKPTALVNGDLANIADVTDNSKRNVNVTCSRSDSKEGTLFPIGETKVTCKATDVFGNVGRCQFKVVVEDLEAPNLICPDISTQTDYRKPTALVNTYPNATDNSLRIANVTCSRNDTKTGNLFPIGETRVTCRAKDFSENVGECHRKVVVKDLEVPHVRCPSDIVTHTDDGKPTALVNGDLANIANATDNSELVVNATCIRNDTKEGTLFLIGGNVFHIGETRIKCKAKDVFGNVGRCNFKVVVIDAEAPKISCSHDILTTADNGKPTAHVLWDPPNVTDNSGQIGEVACSPSFNSSGTHVAIGQNYITCTAIDNSGNLEHCNFYINITDTESPEVRCPDDFMFTTDSRRSTANVVVDNPPARDNSGQVKSVTCSLDANGASWNSVPIGQNFATCIATDYEGNIGNCHFHITITDMEAPDLQCPNGKYVPNENNANYKIVSWGQVTATDNTGTPSVACTPPSGSDFPRGSSQVTCNAVDNYNNRATCDFSVQVGNCNRRLGMEDRSIANSQITASSVYSTEMDYSAYNARLNKPKEYNPTRSGSWSASTNNPHQWIQVDLLAPTWVEGVLIQGRDDRAQWVTSYKVEYSTDKHHWTYVSDGNPGVAKVFTGNTDQRTIVTGLFPSPVHAWLIKIRPASWGGWISLRFELVGC